MAPGRGQGLRFHAVPGSTLEAIIQSGFWRRGRTETGWESFNSSTNILRQRHSLPPLHRFLSFSSCSVCHRNSTWAEDTEFGNNLRPKSPTVLLSGLPAAKAPGSVTFPTTYPLHLCSRLPVHMKRLFFLCVLYNRAKDTETERPHLCLHLSVCGWVLKYRSFQVTFLCNISTPFKASLVGLDKSGVRWTDENEKKKKKGTIW